MVDGCGAVVLSACAALLIRAQNTSRDKFGVGCKSHVLEVTVKGHVSSSRRLLTRARSWSFLSKLSTKFPPTSFYSASAESNDIELT